jgi:CubicO group peptidase (beta-lactamase class C family)
LDPTVLGIQSVQVADKAKVMLGAPALAEPGERFDYGPAPYTALGEVLRRKLLQKKMGTLAYLQHRILDPLKLDGKDWVMDGTGQPIYYAGIRLSARDWLKVGQLLLHQGRWKGQNIVDAALLRKAFEAGPTNAAYGFSFWLNSACERKDVLEADVERWIFEPARAAEWPRACLSKRAPPDVIACIGSGGQRLYVVPSRKLIVLHLGRSPQFEDSEFLARLFR